MAGVSERIKINGVNINTIRYVDDTVLNADSDIGDVVCRACEEFKMKMNIKKVKIMVIKRSQNVPQPAQIDGIVLGQVDKFRYLGCWIDCKLDPDMEIR